MSRRDNLERVISLERVKYSVVNFELLQIIFYHQALRDAVSVFVLFFCRVNKCFEVVNVLGKIAIRRKSFLGEPWSRNYCTSNVHSHR